MSRLKCGDQNWTACSRCGQTRDLYNGRISSLFLYLILRAINPSTLLAVLQFFSVCFCHLRSVVMWCLFLDSAVYLLSATVDWTYYSFFSCCCVRCASQNIYWTSLLISSCSSIMSSGFLAQWQSLVSSANFDILLTILVSFMYIRNSSGPNTLSCGTPDVTGAQLL